MSDGIKASSLPPWRSAIARALHRNRSLAYARYLQLATIDRQLQPHNRTLVFRGWLEPESHMQLITDIRSSKAIELLAGASTTAEACWYFPKTREQFRLSGNLELVTLDLGNRDRQQARQQVWQQMSDSARIQFAWPTPGAERSTDPQAFAPPPPDPQQPSVNFCLLLLRITAVAHLELRGEPQNLDAYRLINDRWQLQSLNP
jgi:pyridoxamine 5'-phosphate oxidase